MVLGQVPDIMEMHYLGKSFDRTGNNREPGIFYNSKSWKNVGNDTLLRPGDEYWMPYRQMSQSGYLEDLWPYIENDPEIGRDGVLQAPVKAAEVNGGLYILFMDFRVNTLMGRESVVGDRYNWTLDELLGVFSTMPEGSTILRYNATKKEVFDNLLCFSLEQFVDREMCICSFDSEKFREILAFLSCFPDEVDIEQPQQIEEEIMRRIKNGKQMLEIIQISGANKIIYGDALWEERAAFVGYPTADGSSGNFFYPMGDILAMSSACQNKDAAWEYIRELIKPRRNTRNPKNTVIPNTSIPINQHDYELFIWGSLVYLVNNCLRFAPDDPTSFMGPWNPFTYGPPIYPMELLTEEDCQRFDTLINSTTQLYWPNDELADIVWDTIGPYLAGDRTLDDTVALVQNRATLYVNENR